MSKKGYVQEVTECSVIPLNVLQHIETKQLLCNENQLTDFYVTQVFIECSFRANSNSN